MMIRMFEPQLGKNIEVYIDDMVVKSKLESEHVNNLGGIFEILGKHKLRLNASKCSFGVGSRKFFWCWSRDVRIQEYLSQVRHLQSRFESFNLLHIPRSGNTHTDSMATLATTSAQGLPRVILVEDLCKPTEMKREMVHIHQIRVGTS